MITWLCVWLAVFDDSGSSSVIPTTDLDNTELSERIVSQEAMDTKLGTPSAYSSVISHQVRLACTVFLSCFSGVVWAYIYISSVYSVLPSRINNEVRFTDVVLHCTWDVMRVMLPWWATFTWITHYISVRSLSFVGWQKWCLSRCAS